MTVCPPFKQSHPKTSFSTWELLVTAVTFRRRAKTILHDICSWGLGKKPMTLTAIVALSNPTPHDTRGAIQPCTMPNSSKPGVYVVELGTVILNRSLVVEDVVVRRSQRYAPPAMVFVRRTATYVCASHGTSLVDWSQRKKFIDVTNVQSFILPNAIEVMSDILPRER